MPPPSGVGSKSKPVDQGEPMNTPFVSISRNNNRKSARAALAASEGER